MASSGFLVVCSTGVPVEAFAQFAISFIPLKPPPLLLASADPETVRLISAFSALIGREGKIDHRLDSRHSAGIRKALRNADLQQYQLVSEDFEEESEELYRRRILGTVQRATGVLLISKEAWAVLSNGELQESVVVKICGEEAEEIADFQAFRIFTSPLPGKSRPGQSVKSSFHPPDQSVPSPKPIFQAEEEDPLIAAIEAVLDAPPDSREALRSQLKSELKAGLNAIKTHYEEQLKSIRSEWQKTMEIWAGEKARLMASIEHLEQHNGGLRMHKLEERLSQLQQTADKLYEGLPALKEKTPPLALQALITPEGLTLSALNRKPYDINHLNLVIKGENGLIVSKCDINVPSGAQGTLSSPNHVDFEPPIYVTLVQGDREIVTVVAHREVSGIEEKFQRVRKTLAEGWTPQLESCLLTLRQNARAADWSEADLIDLLFNLQSKDN